MALVKFNGDYTPTLLEKFWNDELNFIDEMFRRPFSMFNGNGMNQYGKINVIDNTDNYTLEVYLPGAGKDDVNVEIADGCLTIKSDTKKEYKDENKNYLRHEFSYSAFERSFTLPDDVKDEDVEAEFKDGVLYIKLKKEKALEQPKEVKRIEIKGS